jgi:carboxypeptidase Taq
MMAAQLSEALRAALPALDAQIAEGDFRPLLAWLRANIHEHGSLLQTRELLTAATGHPLEPQPFLDHLQARYPA